MKPFFYKLNAADFLEKILSIPEAERGIFVLQFALDLVCAKSEEKFTKKIITEANIYQKKKVAAGKSGGLARSKNLKNAKNQSLEAPSITNGVFKHNSSKPQAEAKSCSSITQANSSSSSSNIKSLKEESKDVGTFVPPTQEQVADYCKLRENKVDPIRWRDFYLSKGWMVGKNKMKDWKAAVRTWERNTPNDTSYGAQGMAVLDELGRRANGSLDSERSDTWPEAVVCLEVKKLPTGRHDPEDS